MPSEKRYLDLFTCKVNQWKLKERQFKLEASTTPGVPLTPAQKQEADAIDYLKTKAMLWAEKKCRKLRMGNVAFSVAVSEPIKRIQFWEMAIRRNSNGHVNPRVYSRKKKAAGVVEPVGRLSNKEMLEKLKQAQLDYREAKKKHREHRQKFLETLDPRDRKRLVAAEEARRRGKVSKQIRNLLELNLSLESR